MRIIVWHQSLCVLLGQSERAIQANSILSNMRTRVSLLLFFLVVSVWVEPIDAASGSSIDKAATSLHISAKIDGTDELHISHQAALWDHGSWGWPTDVKINGQPWSPRKLRVLKVGPNTPFLRPDIELAGATIRKIRGRGTVKLGCGPNGLIIGFNDEGQNGAATYEVIILFADPICKQSQRLIDNLKSESDQPMKTVELDIQAKIDGADAVHISSDRAEWAHYEASWPQNVSLNGRSWDARVKSELLATPNAFFPAGINVSAAELIEKKGRGAVQLFPTDDRLTIRFDDRQPSGAGDYLARVRIPITQLWRVEIQCDEPAHVFGAQLNIVRYEGSEDRPKVVSSQHVFDRRGRTIVALPRGSYRFEVQHQPRPNVVVALKSGRVNVESPARVRLRAVKVPTPRMMVSGRRGLELTQLAVRSILPTGAVEWKRRSRANRVSLVLSPDETYRVRAFGSRGSIHAALWKELKTGEIRRITEPEEQLTRCFFDWHAEALRHSRAGVKLVFPDSTHEFPVTTKTQFLTNRRFVALGYGFQLKNGRKIVFHPRGYVLPEAQSDHRFELGGPLVGRATAAILTNEKLGSPNAKQLWADISAVDPKGHILDTRESTVDWKWEVKMRDGEAPPKHPLSAAALQRLGKPSDTVLLAARFHLNKPVEWLLPPEGFVPRQSNRVSTTGPAYMDWRTTAYLAKVERSLREIARERELPVGSSYRVTLTWWLNSGAVGGHGGTTMPLSGMVDDFSWFSHPWALSHELLHGFGYGHNPDMERTDGVIQRRFEEHRWFAADHPEFVPDFFAKQNAASK